VNTTAGDLGFRAIERANSHCRKLKVLKRAIAAQMGEPEGFEQEATP